MEEKRDKKTSKHTEYREEIGNPFSPPVSGNAQGRGPTIYPTPDVKTDASIISAP